MKFNDVSSSRSLVVIKVILKRYLKIYFTMNILIIFLVIVKHQSEKNVLDFVRARSVIFYKFGSIVAYFQGSN